jgi:hypothetical protein
MAYAFIEMYAYKKAWFDLDAKRRAEFIATIKGAVSHLQKTGVEVLAYSFNNRDTDRRNSADFFAVYKLPSNEAAKGLMGAIAGSGWYDYFEQTNAGGTLMDPGAVLDAHCDCKTP